MIMKLYPGLVATHTTNNRQWPPLKPNLKWPFPSSRGLCWREGSSLKPAYCGSADYPGHVNIFHMMKDSVFIPKEAPSCQLRPVEKPAGIRAAGEQDGRGFFSDYSRPNCSPLFYFMPLSLGGDGSGAVLKYSGSRRSKIWIAHLRDPSWKPPQFCLINQSNWLVVV